MTQNPTMETVPLGSTDLCVGRRSLGGRPKPFDPKNMAALRESLQQSLRLLGEKVRHFRVAD